MTGCRGRNPSREWICHSYRPLIERIDHLHSFTHGAWRLCLAIPLPAVPFLKSPLPNILLPVYSRLAAHCRRTLVRLPSLLLSSTLLDGSRPSQYNPWGVIPSLGLQSKYAAAFGCNRRRRGTSPVHTSFLLRGTTYGLLPSRPHYSDCRQNRTSTEESVGRRVSRV